MILMGKEFLGVGKILLKIELRIFLPIEKDLKRNLAFAIR